MIHKVISTTLAASLVLTTINPSFAMTNLENESGTTHFSRLAHFSAGALYLSSYLTRGHAETIDLANLGKGGITITVGNSLVGYSVSAAGDVNGDGIDDFIIGSPNTNTAYVVLGNRNLPSLNIDNIQDYAISITGFSETGHAVSGAGDVNQDGFADMLISSCYDPESANYYGYGMGTAYLVYGNKTLSNISLQGDSSSEWVGFIGCSPDSSVGGCAVSGVGDVNQDGYPDFLIGDYSTNKAYLVYGSKNLQTTFLSNLGEGGITFTGPSSTGWSVGGAGDVNNDGFPDMILGNPNYEAALGVADVVFGSRDLSNLVLSGQSSEYVSIPGTIAGSQAGYSVSGAGDVNGDGFADVLIGAPSEYESGTASLYYGGTSVGSESVTFSSSSNAGYSVSSAGDINNDGYPDILIGNPTTNTVSLIYGGPDLQDTDLNNLGTSGVTFFTSNIGDYTAPQVGYSVSGAGDVNGDGYPDILIGAPYYSNNTANTQELGITYLVYGGFDLPSSQPSTQPSNNPSTQPSRQPSFQPISFPSNQPTNQPTSQPVRHPTSQPTQVPSDQPTLQPAADPTNQPTEAPSDQPTLQPVVNPTSQPTSQPSTPSSQPTGKPSTDPSTQPSSQPSKVNTNGQDISKISIIAPIVSACIGIPIVAYLARYFYKKFRAPSIEKPTNVEIEMFNPIDDKV